MTLFFSHFSLGDVMLEIVQNETKLENHNINLTQLYMDSGFELDGNLNIFKCVYH